MSSSIGTSQAAEPETTTTGFVLHQRIRYVYSAPVTNLRQRLLTIPPETYASQVRSHWQTTVEGAEACRLGSEVDSFGNFVVRAAVDQVDEAIEFVISVKTGRRGCGEPHLIPADPRYQRPTALTRPDAAIRELARAASDGVPALCAAVHASLTYCWGVTRVHTTAAQALAGGRGVCQDYAHIMLAACRATGIAARYVSGHLPGEGSSHAWIEVLSPDPSGSDRWIAEGWDPTHNRRITSGYLSIAAGRDYRDAAPMSGTFDGDGVDSALTVTKHLDRQTAA